VSKERVFIQWVCDRLQEVVESGVRLLETEDTPPLQVLEFVDLNGLLPGLACAICGRLLYHPEGMVRICRGEVLQRWCLPCLNTHLTGLAPEAQVWNATPDPPSAIRECLQNFAEFLAEKNTRYGDSALHPAQVFSSTPAQEQICNRLDDKLSRIKHAREEGEVLRKNDVADVLGYVALLCVANGWLNFEDLLD